MKGVTIWFTGLPCSGKTTLALRLNEELKKKGIIAEPLDGDVTRKYLSKGLGFSKEDRDENIRRVGFVCSLLTRHGAVTTAAFVSPYRSIRAEIRSMIGDFVEVYVKCSLDRCIERDVKGMYKRAIAGEIPNFTGISDPYEEPENPEIIVETDRESEEESLRTILDRLVALGYLAESGRGIHLPGYQLEELEKIRRRESHPDLNTLLIDIIRKFLDQSRTDQGNAPGDEETTEIRERLKKLGYLTE